MVNLDFTESGGINYYKNPNMISLIGHDNDFDNAVNNTEFDYNPERLGYYVGTPEIKISYDTNSSSYAINNLHQSWRIPAYDQYGNQIENAGEEAVMLKRLAQIAKTATWEANNINNPHYVNPLLRSSFQQPVQRYGGVCMYNWAQTTARKYGDKDWSNPAVYNQDQIHLLRFDEYFTSTKKAQQEWEKTMWYRLGFSYEQLANPNSYEKNVYYDHPFDDRCRVFGTTTRADIGVDSLPSVSTVYNPTVSINKDDNAHLAPRLYDG